jgi:hypothetical protein
MCVAVCKPAIERRTKKYDEEEVDQAVCVPPYRGEEKEEDRTFK